MAPREKKTQPQRILDRLAERWHTGAQQPVNCTLGRKPLPRRGGACSACTVRREFELDEMVARLINERTFSGISCPGTCPYQIVGSQLIAGLTVSGAAFRARSRGPLVDPVLEIKQALRHLRSVMGATSVSHEDIEALADAGDPREDAVWRALLDVHSAQRALKDALATFRSQAPKPSSKRRGRIGALEIQAVAAAMARAWRVLTGGLPAKDNLSFHDLLEAAVATVFGHPAREPNWEAATRTAVTRIRKDDASGT